MVTYCKLCSMIASGKFCWKCGEKTVDYILACPFCKTKISLLNKFCEECGKPVQDVVNASIGQNKEGGGEGGKSNEDGAGKRD